MPIATLFEGKSLAALAEEHGLPKATIYERYKKGQRGEELTRPQDIRDTVVRGKTLSEWAWELTKATGRRIDRPRLYNRLKYQRATFGFSTEKALAVAANNYLKEAQEDGLELSVKPLV